MDFYRKYMELLPTIYPQFRSAITKNGKELILLIENTQSIKDLSNVEVDDCSEFEALENHVHLFDKVGKKNKDNVTIVGTAIAKNMLESLKTAFPDKKFVVYLEVNIKDSVIIRFHQIREKEPLYFEMVQSYKEIEIFEFMN